MNDTTSAASSASSSPARSGRAPSSAAHRRRGATAAALGLAGIAVVSLTGCTGLAAAVEEAVSTEQVQQRHYDAYSDAPTSRSSDDLAWFLPAWVPDDARDIDVRLDTTEPGYELSFTSEKGVDLTACAAVDGDVGGPALAPETLPEPLPSTGLVSCGDGRVTAEVDGRWASWTTVDEVPGDGGDNTTLRP